MKITLYINLRTHERTNDHTLAMSWHKADHPVEIWRDGRYYVTLNSVF